MSASARKNLERLHQQVEAVLATPYGNEAANVMLEGYRTGNTWHGHSTCEHNSGSTMTPTKVALKKVTEQVTRACPDPWCLRPLLYAPRSRNRGAAPSAVDRLWEALEHLDNTTKVEKLEEPLKTESAPNVERRRAAAERLRRTCEEKVAAGGTGAAEYETLRRRVETVLEGLDEKSRDGDHQEKVLTWVRRDLLPKQLAHLDPKDFTLDESPTLVGITPYIPSQNNQKVRALVEAFAVRNHDHTVVLVVPRYVYDHLQRSRIGRLSGETLMQGIPAPADPKVTETAAGLWDPEGTAELASLADAVNAAEILTS